MLLYIQQALTEGECPDAVTEVKTRHVEIIRVPAYFDGRSLWQGATFIRRMQHYEVQFDDGRRHHGTEEDVVEFFKAEVAEWHGEREAV